MIRPDARLTRLVSSLAIAAMLAFGVRSALATPAQTSCPLVSEGMFDFACTVGPAGDATCTTECERRGYTPGECFQDGCCLCYI